jgi:hypothetical protein
MVMFSTNKAQTSALQNEYAKNQIVMEDTCCTIILNGKSSNGSRGVFILGSREGNSSQQNKKTYSMRATLTVLA